MESPLVDAFLISFSVEEPAPPALQPALLALPSPFAPAVPPDITSQHPPVRPACLSARPAPQQPLVLPASAISSRLWEGYALATLHISSTLTLNLASFAAPCRVTAPLADTLRHTLLQPRQQLCA
jgi:hypothetical protein